MARADGDTGSARKERDDSGDVVNVLPEGTVVSFWFEWNGRSRSQDKVRIIRRKGKHSLLSIRGRFAEEVFKALEQFHRDLPARCQHADCRNLAGPQDQQRVEAWLRASKAALAQSVSSLLAESAAVTRFHFEPTRNLPSGSVGICQKI